MRKTVDLRKPLSLWISFCLALLLTMAVSNGSPSGLLKQSQASQPSSATQPTTVDIILRGGTEHV